MAFTFINSARYTSGSSNSAVCNKPTDTADDDIMIAVVDSAASYNNSAPSGWASLGQTEATYFYQLYWKKASSEGASYTWGFASNQILEVVIATYRGGFDLSDPIDVVSNTSYVTSNTICRAASMSVSNANSPLVFIGTLLSGSVRTFTKPSVPTTDWVENHDAGTAGRFSTTFDSMVWTSSGATGDMDATISATIATKHAFAVALNPLVSGPANLKTYNTNAKANIKTINTNAIANVKTLNTNA